MYNITSGECGMLKKNSTHTLTTGLICCTTFLQVGCTCWRSTFHAICSTDISIAKAFTSICSCALMHWTNATSGGESRRSEVVTRKGSWQQHASSASPAFTLAMKEHVGVVEGVLEHASNPEGFIRDDARATCLSKRQSGHYFVKFRLRAINFSHLFAHPYPRGTQAHTNCSLGLQWSNTTRVSNNLHSSQLCVSMVVGSSREYIAGSAVVLCTPIVAWSGLTHVTRMHLQELWEWWNVLKVFP